MQHIERRVLRDGLAAVAVFAAAFPLTDIARSEFAPLPLFFGQLLGAGVFALVLLNAAKVSLPKRGQLGGLVLVALGGAVGFPLLIALDGQAVLALTPWVTAVWGWLRATERPAPMFWFGAVVGSGVVLHFVWRGGAPMFTPEALALALAMGIANAEGGHLARDMPGWQVVAWALVLVAPGAALGFGYTWANLAPPADAAPWLALAFLALVVQFGAFCVWYRVLSTSISRASQLQLLQPLLAALLAVALLEMTLPPAFWLHGLAVMVVIGVLWKQAGRTFKTPKEIHP